MIESMPARLDNQIYRPVSECTFNDRLVAIAVENALDYEDAIRSRDKETKQRLHFEKEIRAEFWAVAGSEPSSN